MIQLKVLTALESVSSSSLMPNFFLIEFSVEIFPGNNSGKFFPN